MPPAIPLRHRRPTRRLLVAKPRTAYFQIPDLTPGVHPPRLTFDALIRRLRAMPPDSHGVIGTFPVPGGGWDSSLGCEAEVGAHGDVELSFWVPSPAVGEDA